MGYDIVDYNGEQQTGFSLYQFTMRRGYRCSTAKAFLSPVKMRKNLHVALYSHVTRILIDQKSRRAYGVEYIRNGKKATVYAKKEVVLSAGALNSPQLLMLSGIGPHDHLSELGIPVVHDLPGVGQNLQDHIAVGGIVFTVDYPISLVMNRIVTTASAVRYAALGKGPLTSSVGLETVAFITTKYGNITDDWPDIEFMLTSSSTPSDGGTAVRNAHGLTDKFYEEYLSELNYKDLFGVFPMILRPKSRGYMKLRSANPLAHPLFYHNYLTHPDDVRTLREGVKAGIAIGETEAMKRFGAKFHAKPLPGCHHLPLYTDEYWDCYIRHYTMTIYHMSGTCKMGPDYDPYSVVDPTLRVYGVQGLRVIDASIMPRITSGNINAPVIMIAEKGADLIKEYWSGKEAENVYKRAPTPLPYAYLKTPQPEDYKQQVFNRYTDYVNSTTSNEGYGQPHEVALAFTQHQNPEYYPQNGPSSQTAGYYQQDPRQTVQTPSWYSGDSSDHVLFDNTQDSVPANSWIQQRIDRNFDDGVTVIEDEDEFTTLETMDSTTAKSETTPGKMKYSDIVGTSYEGTMMEMMRELEKVKGHS
uniref:Glucose dehydrogenase [FAD, quinone] n=2 Tax=Cacopsylla melanoneura TaxID=428564 RepID=A0A8D9E6E0_9HEMI